MAIKCQRCGAPLTGPMSYLNRILGVKASDQNPNICNKCVAREKTTDTKPFEQIMQKEESPFRQAEQAGETNLPAAEKVEQPKQAMPALDSNEQENVDRQSAKTELENELK